MCGIAGYINLDNLPIKDSACINNMLKAQKHRGPDDSGIRAFSLSSGQSEEIEYGKTRGFNSFYDGIIGFNRLSILDLSLNGHQPMVSPDDKVLIMLNGEIYNAFDYKSELEQWGYRFRSLTDTEVVLALYLKYGFEGMLYRINGMYAIVVIDLRIRNILIARDRFGIKPMYFFIKNGIFAFSSELKSFLYISSFTFQLAEDQLDEYLMFRNNVSGTLFKDIESLSPGNYLVFTHGMGCVKKCFFEINDHKRTSAATLTLEEYADQLEGLLSNSVKSQLMSDVKLGCQLSGGVDSSLITWFANRNINKGHLETVSIIFNDPRFSEENYINKVTQALGINSHKFLLESEYYLANIEKATWHLESPINHPNTIAIYKLSQCAKEYVTVLLSGEGADEVFGGYERFYNISYPYSSRRLFHEIKNGFKYPNALRGYFDNENRAIMATAFMSPEIAKELINGFNADHATESRRFLYNKLTGSLFDRQVKYEILTYLPDLLIRQDKMSMAHSIENRVPFLDNEVVSGSFNIPERYLVLRKSSEGYNNEKYLLKRITASNFGQDFAFRKKMGFGIPLREFMMDKQLSDYLLDKVLPSIRQRELFNYRIVSKWFSNLTTLKYYEIEALWIIFSFEIWAAIYLSGNYEIRYTSD